jgi:uncharacterized tellurite resistance protein B-like protein
VNIFKTLFSRGERPDVENRPEDDFRLAVAALLVEAARADDQYDEREAAIIEKSLAATFDLSHDEATSLRTAGEAAQMSALDIQRFTRVAKQMSAEEKVAFVERLWEIVLSDGERDPFEDALMRRICGLIYLDDRESGAARARVAAKLGLN